MVASRGNATGQGLIREGRIPGGCLIYVQSGITMVDHMRVCYDVPITNTTTVSTVLSGEFSSSASSVDALCS